MITVKYLKECLRDLPDNSLVYAYEGEMVGIVVVSPEVNNLSLHKSIAFIGASENEDIEISMKLVKE